MVGRHVDGDILVFTSLLLSPPLHTAVVKHEVGRQAQMNSAHQGDHFPTLSSLRNDLLMLIVEDLQGSEARPSTNLQGPFRTGCSSCGALPSAR